MHAVRCKIMWSPGDAYAMKINLCRYNKIFIMLIVIVR